MITIDRHALSIGHNEDGVAVAIILTPDSIGVEAEALKAAQSYRYAHDERTITLCDAEESPVIRLVDVGAELISACGSSLPIIVMDNNGESTLQVISQIDRESRDA